MSEIWTPAKTLNFRSLKTHHRSQPLPAMTWHFQAVHCPRGSIIFTNASVSATAAVFVSVQAGKFGIFIYLLCDAWQTQSNYTASAKTLNNNQIMWLNGVYEGFYGSEHHCFLCPTTLWNELIHSLFCLLNSMLFLKMFPIYFMLMRISHTSKSESVSHSAVKKTTLY